MNLREELKKSQDEILEEEEEWINFIIVAIKDKLFAFEIDKLFGVGKIEKYIELPVSPSYIKGIQFLYGNVIILFDIINVLEGTNSHNNDELSTCMITILKYDEDFFGVIVDELLDTVKIAKSKITFTPDAKEFYKGTFKHKDKSVSILNIEEIVKSTYN